MKAFSAVVAVTLAGGAVLYALTANPDLVRLSQLYMAGQSPQCSYPQAVRSLRNGREQEAIKDRILAASKRLERDAQGYELWETPKGRYWIPQGSHYVLPFNLAEQERRIYGEGQNGVRTDDVVLDCGANIGVFTREALKAGAKLVVAIEPAPENLECLRRNFAEEIRAGRVVVYPKGVWDKDDVLELSVDPHNSAADTFVLHPEGAHGGITAPLTTIDKLVPDLKLERVDFIKMDIEGAEPKALTGARQTISRWKPRIAVSAYHEPDHPVTIPQAIKAARADYQMECGPCALTKQNVIRPDVLQFH